MLALLAAELLCHAASCDPAGIDAPPPLAASTLRPLPPTPPAPPTDLGHKLLNNPVIWIGMEREWEIGTQASRAGNAASRLATLLWAAALQQPRCPSCNCQADPSLPAQPAVCKPPRASPTLGDLPDSHQSHHFSEYSPPRAPLPQLRAALQDPAGQLPGFMRVCDCLVRGDEGEEGGGRAAFSGMIMEKLNGGWCVAAGVHVSPPVVKLCTARGGFVRKLGRAALHTYTCCEQTEAKGL